MVSICHKTKDLLDWSGFSMIRLRVKKCGFFWLFKIRYLHRTNFCVYLFSRAKKNRILRVLAFANSKFLKISHEYLFFPIANFWKFHVYKFHNNIALEIIRNVFEYHQYNKYHQYNSRRNVCLKRRNVNTALYSTETMASLGVQIWNLVLKNFQIFLRNSRKIFTNGLQRKSSSSTQSAKCMYKTPRALIKVNVHWNITRLG